MTTFNEAQHPRKSEGTSQGGQFTNVINSEPTETLSVDAQDSPADVAARIRERQDAREKALRATMHMVSRASAEYGALCASNIAEYVATMSPHATRVAIEREIQDGYFVTYAGGVCDASGEDILGDGPLDRSFEEELDAWAANLHDAVKGEYFKEDDDGEYIDVNAWRQRRAPDTTNEPPQGPIPAAEFGAPQLRVDDNIIADSAWGDTPSFVDDPESWRQFAMNVERSGGQHDLGGGVTAQVIPHAAGDGIIEGASIHVHEPGNWSDSAIYVNREDLTTDENATGERARRLYLEAITSASQRALNNRYADVAGL